MAPHRIIDIHRQSKKWGRIVSKNTFKNVVDAVATILGIKESFELTIVLADDAFIQTLNAQYRGKNKPTDVLSFPQFSLEKGADFPLENLNLGDIILSYETIERDALAQQKNFLPHVLHMATHGLLHLLGYDHLSDKEAEEMESLEIKILARLGVLNPYE
jgi:probable rRNA maturation factor